MRKSVASRLITVKKRPYKPGDDLIISDEQVLLHTRIGDVQSATVSRVGNTGASRFYRFNFSDWVNIVALTDDLQLVLIKQFRFGSQQVEIEIPGGAIERNELPLIAGLRELMEETGYAGDSGRIIGKVQPNPALQSNWCYTILVENVKRVANQQMDEMEDIEVVTIPLEQMQQMVAQGEISHGLVLNALMFYEYLQKE